MIRKILALALAASLLSLPVSAQTLEKEIVADGTAAGGSIQSKEAATNRALRAAIEQAVGTIIDSETAVENFQLLDDKIYSEVKGYVISYEVIEDNGGAGGVYKVKVRAIVALGVIAKDVKGLGIIREKINNPRIMVIVSEYVDGIEQPQHIIGTAIEQGFMENKFPVVSKDQTEMIKERDATLSYADPAKAAALGRRFGAEVVVVGQATANLVDTSTPYGVSVFAYEARVEAKAVKTDNAQILAVDTLSETARANGRVPAANKAFTQAADKIADSFMKKIAEAWRSEVYNEMNVEIVCANADMTKAAALKKALSGVAEVKGVNERSLVNNILELDVRFFGSSDQLAAILLEIKDVKVEVTSKTPNRIDIKFTE